MVYCVATQRHLQRLQILLPRPPSFQILSDFDLNHTDPLSYIGVRYVDLYTFSALQAYIRRAPTNITDLDFLALGIRALPERRIRSSFHGNQHHLSIRFVDRPARLWKMALKG
jgi:hypothetical protein